MRQKEIKELNDYLDEIIDKSKSFEDQIKSIRKIENLYDDYYYLNNFGDKELKFKIFKLRLAHLSNEIDEDLFKDIEKNRYKLFEMDKFNDWVIQPNDRYINLKDAIDLILDFNEERN